MVDGVESKLEEMLLMKESPEKVPDLTKDFLDVTVKELTDQSNAAFSAAPHQAPPGTLATSVAVYMHNVHCLEQHVHCTCCSRLSPQPSHYQRYSQVQVTQLGVRNQTKVI